jgi:hypothetical protein
MQKGRKQKTTYSELDLLYCRHVFKSFINKPAKTRKIKRQMNRRYRQEQKKITEEDYEKDL